MTTPSRVAARATRHGRGRRLVTALVCAASTVAALGLSACGDSDDDQTGSATSGSINWWGWTPDAGPAKQYIERIQELIAVPIKWLSVGPSRDAMIAL